MEKLKNAGYDKNKKTTFLWEGVTLYLSEKDIRNTLKEIKLNTAPGSVIIADFYADQFVSGELLPGKKRSLDQLKYTHEELGYGISFEKDSSAELQLLIENENIKIGETHYMGYQTNIGTWMVVVELII